jgi:hypothetical protein
MFSKTMARWRGDKKIMCLKELHLANLLAIGELARWLAR